MWLLLLAGASGLLYYVDRRSNHEYSRTARGLIGDWIMQLRRKRRGDLELSEKIATEEIMTNRNVFDH
jgi:hypothetical protein